LGISASASAVEIVLPAVVEVAGIQVVAQGSFLGSYLDGGVKVPTANAEVADIAAIAEAIILMFIETIP
jgi:hypothetical protein